MSFRKERIFIDRFFPSHRPKENDLVALYHDKKWFRGRCLSTTDTDVNVLCIDSGVVIACSPTSK